MRTKLAIPAGGEHPFSFTLTDLPVTIGRDPDNDIVVGDDSISRKHAEILAGKDGLLIRDLGSANGTFVNGSRVDSSPIADQDVVRLEEFEFKLSLATEEVQASNGETSDWDLSTHSISPEELKAETELGGIRCDAVDATYSVLSFFQRAGAILESAFDLSEILQGILDLTFEIVPAERGFVLLFDPDTGEMAVQARRYREGAVGLTQDDADLSHTILEHATKSGRAVLTTDATNDERFDDAESVRVKTIRSAICVPLKGREETLGAVYVDSRIVSHRFVVNHLKLLTGVGAEMGLAVENARLYEAKVKAERLAAVGTAVAGLGHCIKNILQGMQGGSDLLQYGIEEGNEKTIRQGDSILKRSLTRLNDFMCDMLAYSKPRKPEYEELDPNTVPMEVIQLLQEKARTNGVDLTFVPGQDLPKVTIDAQAVYRALLNLVTNAIDACGEGGGKVEVRTLLLSHGRHFQIVVEDNGAGIAEEDLCKLGNTFFSTKATQGTGFGLPVAYKVIAEHQGNLRVNSHLGKGTAFAITLPVGGPAERRSAELSEAQAGAAEGEDSGDQGGTPQISI